MVELTLPKNSRMTVGKTWPKPEGATNIRAFKVYRWNPDTGENLGGSESLIGKIKISRVLPKFSVAEILADEGIAIGSILRKAKRNE